MLKNVDEYNALMTNADGTVALTDWTVTAKTYSGSIENDTYTVYQRRLRPQDAEQRQPWLPPDPAAVRQPRSEQQLHALGPV